MRYPVDAPGGWQSSTVMLGDIRTVNVIPVTAMHHVLDETHYARMATKWIFVMHDGDVSETLSTNMLYVSPRQQHLRRCYPQQYQLCLVLPHFLALTTRASAQQGTSPQLRQRARSGRHCPTFVASPSKFERTPHARESGWWETWRTSFSSCELQRGPHARGSGWWGGGARRQTPNVSASSERPTPCGGAFATEGAGSNGASGRRAGVHTFAAKQKARESTLRYEDICGNT